MVLILIGLLLVILLPIWLGLILLKMTGVRRVCSLKLLLLPVWIVIGVCIACALLAVGIFALFFFLHAVLG